VKDEIAARCTEVESGARNVDNILTNTVLPSISRVILEALVEDVMPETIQVEMGDGGEFTYSL
jgi:type VI secretion system protein VasG